MLPDNLVMPPMSPFSRKQESIGTPTGSFTPRAPICCCTPTIPLIGIRGATKPYLFFWQAAEEVEEERAKGRRLPQSKGATARELRVARADTIGGMFFSNFIMYFIILTTALHAHGQTDVTTARQAAEALRPLAGDGAYLLFTLGLIGTG